MVECNVRACVRVCVRVCVCMCVTGQLDLYNMCWKRLFLVAMITECLPPQTYFCYYSVNVWDWVVMVIGVDWATVDVHSMVVQ